MNLEMQTTFFNHYLPKLIATILGARCKPQNEKIESRTAEKIAGTAHAGKKLLDLICLGTVKSVDPAHKKIRSRLCARK